jgi:cytochrome c-type biogenesis protein CcmH
MKWVTTMLAAALVSTAAFAIDTELAFEDPEMQARYEHIIGEVRCLKCQNQTLKDSNAFLAADLRREIRRMIEEGLTDDEIYDFLVERYGDFALYNPRPTGKTLVLWIGPAVFLLVGAFVLFNIVRRRSAMPINDQEGG